MARFVELRRHTANDGDVLTEAGIEHAVTLGASLTGIYSVVFSSGAQRATQTAASMLAGHGESIARGVVVEPRLRSEHEDVWRTLYERTGAGDLQSFLSADEEFVEAEAERLAEGMRSIMMTLGHGEMALAIGHSPTNEAAVYGLTGSIIPPLAKGEGVTVVEDAGGFRVEKIR